MRIHDKTKAENAVIYFASNNMLLIGKKKGVQFSHFEDIIYATMVIEKESFIIWFVISIITVKNKFRSPMYAIQSVDVYIYMCVCNLL